MFPPRHFLKEGKNHFEHIGGKARICRSIVKEKNKYALFIQRPDHRGAMHWDLSGVYDSADDAASAFQYSEQAGG